MLLDYRPEFGNGWLLSTGIDDVAGRNGLAPMARFIRMIAQHYSAAGALIPRTLFCQHTLAGQQGDLGSPLMRMRYRDNFLNGRLMQSPLLFLPPFTADPGAGAPVPIFTAPFAGTLTHMDIAPGQQEPDDLDAGEITEDQTPISGAYQNVTVATANSFRMTALALDLIPRVLVGGVDTTWGAAVNPARWTPGNVVVDGALADLRLLEDRLWRQLRHVWAAWSSILETPARARTVTGTAYTNLISLLTADATWSAQRPGEIVSAENAGLGPQTAASGGDRLGHRCAIYADATVANGEVRFASSLGNVVITVPFGVAPAWIEAAATLPIPTTQEYDNVVISARNGNVAGDTRTWRWMIQPEP